MATNKTSFLNMNDWVGTDPFKREEINDNFRKLDAKAKEHDDSIGSLSKAASEYEWTSTAGQLTYVMPSGQTYDPTTKWFEVTVGGAPVPLSQIQMDSASQFTLLVSASAIPAGVKVVARWTEPFVPATAGHHTKHELGGADEIDITKLKNFQEQVATPLADIATFVNADKTGVVPASNAINNLIASANDGDEIRFHKGTYLIDSPIIWNKKVTLVADGRVTLKASANIEAIIKATGFTTYTDVHLDGFYLDGNSKADHCIKIDGSTLYAVRTVIENCECRNAVLDGIVINPPAWTIVVKNTLSNSHGRDGIRAIIPNNPQTNQINHVELDNCTFNDNVVNGVNILGLAINISHCDIENNNIGINIDSSTIVSDSYHINIENSCYIEGNIQNQIYVATNTGDGIVLNIDGNYINAAGQSGTIVKCSGITNGITLYLGKNRVQNSSNVIVDGGNALSAKSLITNGMYLNENKFINIGFARVMWDYLKNVPLPVTSCYGVTAKSLYETNNILALTTKSVSFPVLTDVTDFLFHSLYANINSDCSAFNINCYVYEVDIATGNITKSTMFTITGSNNINWGEFIINNWGYYRLSYGKTFQIKFDVVSYTGTTLTISNPYLKVV